MKDLARTFPANDYMSTEEGQAALRRVLLAFSAHQPQVILPKQCIVFLAVTLTHGAFGVVLMYDLVQLRRSATARV